MVTLKVRQTLLQLDELRFAVGSPPGAAVEDHQGTPTVPSLVQIDVLAVLVQQDDVRKAIPDRRANCSEVDAKVEGNSHKCSFIVLWPDSLTVLGRPRTDFPGKGIAIER